MKNLLSPRRVVIVVLALGIASAGAWSSAQNMHSGGHGQGAAHLHDEATMLGVRGENATTEESAEIATLFRGFGTITREVEDLPDGIITITRSTDVAVREALISHSIGMIDCVDQLDDPKILIQSPTLSIFFLRGAAITLSSDIIDDGLVVVQTSDDPEVVAALHAHAAEVKAMTERGMAAVQEMMTGRGTGH